MTHDELISVAWYAILPRLEMGNGRLRTFESNLTATREIPDIISIGDDEDECVVIECKATRQDFLADRKKPFRVYPQMGMGKYRAYVVNEGVVKNPFELPEGWMCYVVIDANTIWEMVGPKSEPQCWMYRYAHKERNWRAEYVTWKTIDYWINKRDHLPKTPDPVGVDQMKLRFLDDDEYDFLNFVHKMEDLTGRTDLAEKIIWEACDRRVEVGREYYFMDDLYDLRALFEGNLERLFRGRLKSVWSWSTDLQKIRMKPFKIDMDIEKAFRFIIPVEDAPKPDEEVAE